MSDSCKLVLQLFPGLLFLPQPNLGFKVSGEPSGKHEMRASILITSYSNPLYGAELFRSLHFKFYSCQEAE